VSPGVQWALVVLGAVGAAGTWLRAYVAWKAERRAAETQRRFEEGR